ncbi:hydrogenase nickel incorporation protein HypB (plasmid) [Afipia carboxidovorans OM5]|uniref:Hydrogenase maturation factor HypB n=1 Tax=Afipia carboxidovorans (strain ATCC 49405 / DSM 1227 / KCTC 32145 / OM5) TaxID=504832 RepID=F8C137_AFIC5|nr:hydrogenase nickel incorporation protein HypB [Afipia carboxidovorans]AEI04519.1 hydrogenase nickel incorporation protein HypB [Afipia carboxidovorans OM4]AEI08147.1 hydrogenase nickel incorporation protein HypB [Afipia carboxidovorans OM5]
MCGHCGCSSETKATVLDLQTGTETIVAQDVHNHAHEHVHADGTRHSHDHGHDHHHDHSHHHDHDHHHDHNGHHHHHHHDHDHDHDGHDHVHADGTRHSHGHHHGHDHAHSHHHDHGSHVQPAEIEELEARVLAKNDALAARNRAWLAGREILAVNIVSSPGAGKTTLLERTISDLKNENTLYVIEGDQATANDGERIRAAGAAAVQVNTGMGCHLEADMVAQGLAALKPPVGATVLIENVGNLVCPALFDLGERAKVVVLSVAEGEDKPLKYPHMFRAARMMLLSKSDLLPHLDFDVAKAVANARKVNPDIAVLQVSSRNGEGMAEWYEWLRTQATEARADAAIL